MLSRLRNMFRVPDLRNKILFTIFIIAVYRVGAHLPVPYVDFAAIISHLRDRDYGGWYVLEQDTILTEDPRGEGPVADVRQSADYLRGLLTGH